ncbi:hypothetical protein IWW38_002178 [Coemansia aciculifera]|uniref:Uncharacterized protein n=1 Tax=Coemansia aciculifera TaxID=417176 RepID=A0ACC1M496_9FUNG|nr:hypothetical protein IWW38_002178 [Coemansia aciculifera]
MGNRASTGARETPNKSAGECAAGTATIDMLCLLYPVILDVYGREAAPAEFCSACALAVDYPLFAGAMVRLLFSMQLFLRTPSLSAAVGRHTGAALFYLDLFEHMIDRMEPEVLEQLVVLPAARFLVEKEYPGPAWFESAHALVLAVLEIPALPQMAVVSEKVALWYGALVLDMYPDYSISAILLHISYTASARITKSPQVAWDLVTVLLCKADKYQEDRARCW